MFYKYKVKFYCTYDDTEPTDVGIVWAKDYGKAANKVANDYGESEVIDIYLCEIGIDGENCLNKEDIDYTFKEE